MRVVVLADTHIRSGSPTRLPGPVYDALATADVVLHAGDVVSDDFLDELAAFGPVHAVRGNNDAGVQRPLPATLELELGGVAVAMVHDSGPRRARAERMKRRFPDAQIVVYGHSHLPDDSDGGAGQRLFNPGSPTQRRRSPARSYGVLELARGRVRHHEIVWVDG